LSSSIHSVEKLIEMEDSTIIHWLAVIEADGAGGTLLEGRGGHTGAENSKSSTGGTHHLMIFPMALLPSVHKRFSSCFLVPSHATPTLLITTMLK